MQISDRQLQKFIDLYQKEFGEVLEKDVALEKAIRLVRLAELVYKPIKINQGWN